MDPMMDIDDYPPDRDLFLRDYDEIVSEQIDVEGLPTDTTNDQKTVEKLVLHNYSLGKYPSLYRTEHITYLKKNINHLSSLHQPLHCSRPWLCYWNLHSLKLLDAELEPEQYSHIAQFLKRCQAPEGGFSGGPGQLPHLASTYAAVSTLCIIGTQEAYDVIDRSSLSAFLKTVHLEDGSFELQRNGEVDIRGVYCAIAVAKLTNIDTPEMFKNTAEWIASCQTWEGGFGGCPGMEAHGGLTYCGLASLSLLGATNLINIQSLLSENGRFSYEVGESCCSPSCKRWSVNKQMRLEGGFQGRTNKLVDACYSFWMGGTFAIINAILDWKGELFDSDTWLFNQYTLQEYLLLNCQVPFGGFVDKPRKYRDIYHTCYALSGLSIAQHSRRSQIISEHQNSLQPVHPTYNLVLPCVNNALAYFKNLPAPQ